MEAYSILIWLFGLAILSIFAFVLIKQRQLLTKTNIDLDNKDKDLKEAAHMLNELHSENAVLQKKLKTSYEDPITSLLSWQMFEDRLKQAIHESIRYHLNMAVLYIDVDDFKVINEALGYETGDRLLKEVARRLQFCVRQVDSISRYNKDTFVAVLTQLGKPETAAVVAQRMLQSMKEPILINENELFVTCCIGISVFPNDGKEAGLLLRNAEEALYIAKQKGKNVYQFYQEGLHVQSQRELAMHTSLSRETIFHEFVCYFQPIVNVKTNKYLCMETILHWQHPQLGLISANELFSYAEKQRKSNLVSEWILKNAGKQFIEWRKEGLVIEYLAIPLSISQLENIHFVYRISQILQEINFNPAWLLIEIKQSAMQLPYEILDKAFNMLQYLGVKIAIENFGNEAFTFSGLQAMQVTYLKVCADIIKSVSETEKNMKMLQAIKAFAEKLSIQVIVDGVETEMQSSLLTDLGFIYLQGRYIQEPMSSQDVASKMLSPLSS